MRTFRTLLLLALVMLIQLEPTTATAQTSTDVERQKAHLVSRLYQATYGAQAHCSSSKQASASLDEAIVKFRSAFPELWRLMDNSPYVFQARDQFKNSMADSSTALSEEALIQECRAIEHMLRQLVELPGGQKAVSEYVQLLKK